MFKWQYINSKYMYVGIQAMSVAIALGRGLTPFHIICSNPTLPFGGLAVASKSKILDRFKERTQYLPHVLLPKNTSLQQRRKLAFSFLQDNALPIIAKPDRGVVGIGVRKINTTKDLEEILDLMPTDYMLQQYCDYPFEYGVFFCKFPNQTRGRIVSLTRKIVPVVLGDGQRTTRELILLTTDIKYNREALLAHARDLNYVPRKGERYQVIVQGSHTYGCVFKDVNDQIDAKLESWMNHLCAADNEFHFGRFDLKLKSRHALQTGDGVKIIELNGCWSEPIHVYDDDHKFGFAAKEFFHSYTRAYKIAQLNKKRLNMKVSYKAIIYAFRSYLRDKNEIIRVMG